MSDPVVTKTIGGLAASRRPSQDPRPASAPAAALPNCRVCNAGEIASLAPDRAASILPADLIHDDEVVILLLRPSPLYIPLSSLGSLVIIALITFALAYLGRVSWMAAWVGWNDTQVFGLGIGLAALRLGWQMLEWWSRIYVLTDRRIIRRMGVLRVSIFQTPLKNIQHTSVFRYLRERFSGLGTIGFATAGSDVYEAYWVMVSQPFAVHRVVNEAIQRYGKRRGE